MTIKNLSLVTLICFNLSIFAQGELKNDKKYWLGPKFGLDIATSTANLASLSDQLEQNYQVGIFMQFGKTLYFQPEIYYSSYTTNSTTNAKISYVKMPLMAGLKFLDLGLLSLHLQAGPSYLKQLDSADKGSINWEIGAGVNILDFITTDLRYTLQKEDTSGFTQIEQLISNGGMVNFTVGLRL